MATRVLKGQQQIEDYLRSNPGAFDPSKLQGGDANYFMNFAKQQANAQTEQNYSPGILGTLQRFGTALTQGPRAFGIGVPNAQSTEQSLLPSEQLRFKQDPNTFRAQGVLNTASFLPVIANPLLGGFVSGAAQNIAGQDLGDKGFGATDIGSALGSGVLGAGLGFAGGKIAGKLSEGVGKIVPQGVKDVLSTPILGTGAKDIAQTVTPEVTKGVKFNPENDINTTANELKGLVKNSRGAYENQSTIKNFADSNVAKMEGIKALPGKNAVGKFSDDVKLLNDSANYFGEPQNVRGWENTANKANDIKLAALDNYPKDFELTPRQVVDTPQATRIAQTADNRPANILTAKDVETAVAERTRSLLPSELQNITADGTKSVALEGGDLEALKLATTKGYINEINGSKNFGDLVDSQIYQNARSKLETIPGYKEANKIQETYIKQQEGLLNNFNKSGVQSGYSPRGEIVKTATRPIAKGILRGLGKAGNISIPKVSLPSLGVNAVQPLVAGLSTQGLPANPQAQASVSTTGNPFSSGAETTTPTQAPITRQEALQQALAATKGKLTPFTLSLADYIMKSSSSGTLDKTQQANLGKLNNASDALGKLYDMYQNIPGTGNRLSGALSNVAAGVGANSKLQSYNNLVNAIKPVIARSLGQLGNLSQQEQNDILNAIPNAQTTPEEAAQQWSYLSDLLNNAKQSITAKTQ